MKKVKVAKLYFNVFVVAVTLGPLLGVYFKEEMHLLAADAYEFYEKVTQSDFFNRRYLQIVDDQCHDTEYCPYKKDEAEVEESEDDEPVINPVKTSEKIRQDAIRIFNWRPYVGLSPYNWVPETIYEPTIDVTPIGPEPEPEEEEDE